MILNDPLVTITVPCYRQGELIQFAVDSILAQTYKNIEILISEDPSDSESTKYIKKYFDDNRVKYFKHPSRVGMVANYQSLFRKISGDLAVNLDGDDAFVNEHYLERCVSEFLNDHDLVLSVSGIRINNNGSHHELMPNTSSEIVHMSGREYFLDSILDKTRTNHHFAMMYKVEIARQIGFYTENIDCPDLESFRRLVLHGNVVQINQLSGVWNISDQSNSKGLSAAQYYKNIIFISSPLNYAQNKKIINSEEYKELLKSAIARFNFQFLIYATSKENYIKMIFDYFNILKKNGTLIFFPTRGYLKKVIFHLSARFFFGKNIYEKILLLNTNIKNNYKTPPK